MQGLSAKVFQRFARRYPEVGSLGLEAGAVDVVAEQRMADGGKMDPDLVGAAGFQPAFDQGGDGPLWRTKCLQHFVTGARQLAAAAKATSSSVVFGRGAWRARP